MFKTICLSHLTVSTTVRATETSMAESRGPTQSTCTAPRSGVRMHIRGAYSFATRNRKDGLIIRVVRHSEP